MNQIIIITDTEEPGAFDDESSMAVITVGSNFLHQMNTLTTGLKKKHPEFSELRLFGSYAEYYADVMPDQLIDALLIIAESDPSKIEPSKVEEIRNLYCHNGSFKWPDNIEFDLLKLLRSTANEEDDEEDMDELEPLTVDIEEFIAESGDFRCAAYLGNQQVYSKHVPYSWLLDEVAI